MRIVAIPIALAVLLGPGFRSVSAQEEEEEKEDTSESPGKSEAGESSEEPAATVSTSEEQQSTLPEGRVLVQVFGEINMSTDLVAKPFSIAPDIWYGVSNDLTVGIVHSGRAQTGLLGGAGNGLCLAGEDNGCAEIYDNIGLDGRYHFYRSGGLSAAADAGLFVKTFDPLTLALKVGLVGRWQAGSLAVELGPNIFAGLTEREPEAGAVEVGTNKEIFTLPVTAIYALTSKLGLAGQVGATVPFEDAGDFYLIAVSFGAQYMVTEKISADAAFSFPAIAGGPDGTGTDARTLTVGVGYAL